MNRTLWWVSLLAMGFFPMEHIQAQTTEALERSQRIYRPGPLPRFSLRQLDATISTADINAGPLGHLNGRRITTDTLTGHFAILDFWGTWCRPCVEDLPEIQRAWQRFRGDSGVVFLTIDTQDTPEAVRGFMKAKGYDFPVLLDDGFADRAGVSAYPTLLVLDRAGNKLVPRPDEDAYTAIMRLVEEARRRSAGHRPPT
jgi:thiol-disulfide isomerase/thioredoxin